MKIPDASFLKTFSNAMQCPRASVLQAVCCIVKVAFKVNMQRSLVVQGFCEHRKRSGNAKLHLPLVKLPKMK